MTTPNPSSSTITTTSPSTSSLPPNVHVSNHPCVRAKLSQLRSRTADARETKSLVHEIALLVGSDALAHCLTVQTSDVTVCYARLFVCLHFIGGLLCGRVGMDEGLGDGRWETGGRMEYVCLPGLWGMALLMMQTCRTLYPSTYVPDII